MDSDKGALCRSAPHNLVSELKATDGFASVRNTGRSEKDKKRGSHFVSDCEKVGDLHLMLCSE